jgi:RNA polymerase sigma factor (sigma-70 family)
MSVVEASALHAPASLSRLPLATPLLRLRSDDQLVALFRAGSDDAFRVLHDRYRQRLFAYVRQMLASSSRQDAEDVLQDVFVRAFGALRADAREVNVRAWLYRVAHNRCIDHLRRPVPPAAEIFAVSRKPLHDPVDEAQRRDDLKRLVADVARLPEHQRSALLMREIDGMSYADLASALDVTVPAVKSLLVRARVRLVEAQEARDADCGEIRRDLHASYDRGVKASGRARRHLRECAGCREYRGALRGVRRSFAALVPATGVGPAALAAKLLGLGGAGGGAAAAGTAGAGAGSGLAVVGGAGAACKVAAVVCATAITAGGAVEMQRLTAAPDRAKERPRAAKQAAKAPVAAAPVAAVSAAPITAASAAAVPAMRKRRPARVAAPSPREKAERRAAAERTRAARVGAAVAAAPVPVFDASSEGGVAAAEPPPAVSAEGGIAAPEATVVAVPDAGAVAAEPVPAGDATAAPPNAPAVAAPPQTAPVTPPPAPVEAPAATPPPPAEAPATSAPGASRGAPLQPGGPAPNGAGGTAAPPTTPPATPPPVGPSAPGA